MAHFICSNVYWRDNVHADVIVLWLMCHVGSLCVNKILTYSYLFQSYVAHFLHYNLWLQPGSYESWETLLYDGNYKLSV